MLPVGVYDLLLLCISITVVSLVLQGCSMGDNPTILDPDPSRNTKAQAQAMLNEMHEECSAMCDGKCTYQAKDLQGHTKEALECHECLYANCKEEVEKLQTLFSQHWHEPVCQKAIGNAAACWADVSQCAPLATACWTTGSCDYAQLGQCSLDHNKNCFEMYLPCCYSEGDSLGDGSDGPDGPDRGGELDPSTNMCYNDGTPGLTDNQCEMKEYGHDYAYSIPGSMSKGGCCKQRSARQCTIISTPGGLDSGSTFDCTPAR